MRELSSVYLSSMNAMGTGVSVARALESAGRSVTIVVPRRIRTWVENCGSGFAVLDTGEDTPGLDRLYDEVSFALSSLMPGANPDNALLRLGLDEQPSSATRRLAAALRVAWKRHGAIIPNPVVNRILRSLMSHLTPRVFPTSHVVAVSFAARPYLLCAPRLQVDTVLDSWDHPVRKCAGYVTRCVVGWNRELAWEWKDFQGATRVEIGFPVRLGYALRQQAAPADDARQVMMYPIATTSHVREWFMDEMRFLRSFVDTAAASGWQVLVKPKPMSTPQEMPSWLWTHPAVRVGRFQESFGPADYALDEVTNARRISELREVQVVVNTVTTFGLDSAAAGVPVVQLDLRESEEFPALASAARNRHLQRYLYRGPGCIAPGPGLERIAKLMMEPTALLARAAETSAGIRHWLTVDRDGLGEQELMDRAMRRIVEALPSRTHSAGS